MIACWKGIIQEIHFGGSIMPSKIIEKIDPLGLKMALEVKNC
jgi:hypothetical protein